MLVVLPALIQVNKDTIVEALAFDATLAEFFNAFLQLPVGFSNV